MLGAAAFLIAEFLKISYLDVILMATIPTLLFYLGALRHGRDRRAQVRHARGAAREAPPRLELARRYWFHFVSLVSIVVFMLLGLFARDVGVLRDARDVRCRSSARLALIPYDWFAAAAVVRGFVEFGLVKALEGGSVSVLDVAATCAAAGIIVGVVTLTGLGLKFSSIVLDYANRRHGSRLASAHAPTAHDMRCSHRVSRRVDRRPRGAGHRVATSSAR